MDEGPRLHPGDHPTAISGEPKIPVANADTARLLRDERFRAAAAAHFGAGPLVSGKPRSALSAAFHAALDALAYAIENEARPELSLTYAEWASVGNRWKSIQSRRRTSAESVATAIRKWALDDPLIPGPWPYKVLLEFKPSDRRQGNTPGKATLTARFQDRRDRDVRLSARRDGASDLRLLLFGDDAVLATQASALVEYARKIHLDRLYTWPIGVKQPDYRVDLLPDNELVQRRRAQARTIFGALLLPVLMIFPLGAYFGHRQTLKDYVQLGPQLGLQADPTCRDGLPVVRLKVMVVTPAKVLFLVRNEGRVDGPRVTLGKYRLGIDYFPKMHIANDPVDPMLAIKTAITFEDRDVTPGQTYYYNVSTRSILGEEFDFLSRPAATYTKPCP